MLYLSIQLLQFCTISLVANLFYIDQGDRVWAAYVKQMMNRITPKMA
jgi:hypothetical protein